MYVCSCTGVTDRTVRACVIGGASTVDDVAMRCGAGSRCGGCRPVVEELVAEVAIVARRDAVAA